MDSDVSHGPSARASELLEQPSPPKTLCRDNKVLERQKHPDWELKNGTSSPGSSTMQSLGVTNPPTPPPTHTHTTHAL